MFGNPFALAFFLFGIGLLALAVFDPVIFWNGIRRNFPAFERLDRGIRHFNVRMLTGIAGGLIVYGQVRGAADAFFGSFAGQVIFWGGSVALIFLAVRQRRKD